ncbi:hypothetical protein BDV95DRAFT_176057 [Massariosphaeria phaeospora]|uniref:Uncharacterized protein n=1 Tax=Massariosphaeria phaeospora TaxID=100035 RepID=A0A7C8M794_9PLEO|nr:hypothetical protein BDV95DRAFT_176057 [Massariosphaeria phaeospora]
MSVLEDSIEWSEKRWCRESRVFRAKRKNSHIYARPVSDQGFVVVAFVRCLLPKSDLHHYRKIELCSMVSADCTGFDSLGISKRPHLHPKLSRTSCRWAHSACRLVRDSCIALSRLWFLSMFTPIELLPHAGGSTNRRALPPLRWVRQSSLGQWRAADASPQQGPHLNL